MQLTYNGAAGNPVNLLTSAAGFLAASKATALGGRYTYSRSTELGRIDSALSDFESNPEFARLNTLAAQIRAWLGAKQGRFDRTTGVITSKRAGAVASLHQELTNLATLNSERKTAMARIEAALDALDWRRKCLCAELYDAKLDLGAVDACTQDLAEETNFSSGWARVIDPNAPLAFWTAKGADEERRLQQWPTLPMKARIVLQSRAQAEGRAMVWPPWNALPVRPAHVRAGLFCHSSAALAAYVIDANRVQIEAGLTQWRLRSIDIVHQRSPVPGDMSHWWVCINRPDQVNIGGRIRQLTTVADMRLLPLIGGFVVDIWGALWTEQQEHQNVWATSTNLIAHDACDSIPFIRISNQVDSLTVYTHHVY